MNNKSQEEASESVVPRKAVATPADVKRFLTLTAEQVEELRKEQALELYRSRARLTETERRMGRGIELEKHYRSTGNMDGLAEALKLQGKYVEAAEVSSSEGLKKEMEEMAKAVSREDKDCECDSFASSGDHNLPTQYVEFYGYSRKHGRDMPFIRCTKCGCLNARQMSKHLADQREMRHSSKPDSEKLKFFKK